MRTYPKATALGVLAVGAILGAGCSSATDGAPEGPSDKAAQPSHSAAAVPTESAGDGVSPAGVTTRVSVPSDATESQYGQACLAAKRWMDEQGGDPKALVEPYLKILQEPGFVDPGNFDIAWTELTPAQQAGVIMAANGAADGQCS